jgi:hydroxysqualene dehydroxylase
MAKSVAVVGAGWAGLACAVTLAQAGVPVTVFESNVIPGGRARRVDLPNGESYDNGQHLMLGAYKETLRLIELVNTQPLTELVQRFSLVLGNSRTYAATADVLIRKPKVPIIDGLLMLANAQGLTVAEKFAFARFMAATVLFTIDDATRTVGEEIARLSPTLRERVIAPLCLAALNTPVERASAIVFQNVIRASLGAGAQASDMLLPKVDLSALFPSPAVAHIEKNGGTVHLGELVIRLLPTPDGRYEIITKARQQAFDQVVVALAPHSAAKLLVDVPAAQPTAAALEMLRYEPITTFYTPLQSAHNEPRGLPLTCVNDPRVQWVVPHHERKFQAIVVSGVEANVDNDRQAHLEHIAELTKTNPARVVRISERRATYSCTPQSHARLVTLPRPSPPLWLVGDYCYPEFPATLEAAVRSGVRTADDIITG